MEYRTSLMNTTYQQVVDKLTEWCDVLELPITFKIKTNYISVYRYTKLMFKLIDILRYNDCYNIILRQGEIISIIKCQCLYSKKKKANRDYTVFIAKDILTKIIYLSHKDTLQPFIDKLVK